MSLSQDLKTIISNHGVDILSNPQVINYFSDLGIARNYPYTIPILKDILSHYGDDIVETYKTQDKPSLEKLIGKYRDKYLNMSVYDRERVVEIFDALAFSLNSHLNVIHSDDHTDNVAALNDELKKVDKTFEKGVEILEGLVEYMQEHRQSIPYTEVTKDYLISWGKILDDIERSVSNFGNTVIESHNLSTYDLSTLSDLIQQINKMICEISELQLVKLEIQRTYESFSSPPRIDNNTTWESMELNNDHIIYNYTVDDMRLITNKATKRKSISDNIYKSSVDPESFFHKIARAGIGICYHYTDSINNQSFDIAFTNEELKRLLQEPMSDTQLLEYKVKNENSTLPRVVDSITTLEQIIIGSDYVVYIGKIDPYSKMKNLQKNFNNLKQVIARSIVNANDINKRFFRLVARLGMGLHYHYHSDPPTGFMRLTVKEPATLDIFFSNKELQQLV